MGARGSLDRDQIGVARGCRSARLRCDRYQNGAGIRGAAHPGAAYPDVGPAREPGLVARRPRSAAGVRLGQAQPRRGGGAAQAWRGGTVARRRIAKIGALMRFNSKLPDVGTTIFTVMSRRAAEENALNIGQGFPDYAIDPRLANSLIETIAEGRNQYAPMEGTIELREQISRKLNVCYHRRFDPHTEITVTCGATEALYDAIQTVAGPGDEVILFDQAYDNNAQELRVRVA